MAVHWQDMKINKVEGVYKTISIWHVTPDLFHAYWTDHSDINVHHAALSVLLTALQPFLSATSQRVEEIHKVSVQV